MARIYISVLPSSLCGSILTISRRRSIYPTFINILSEDLMLMYGRTQRANCRACGYGKLAFYFFSFSITYGTSTSSSVSSSAVISNMTFFWCSGIGFLLIVSTSLDIFIGRRSLVFDGG